MCLDDARGELILSVGSCRIPNHSLVVGEEFLEEQRVVPLYCPSPGGFWHVVFLDVVASNRARVQVLDCRELRAESQFSG
jgi:hypothetical protein